MTSFDAFRRKSMHFDDFFWQNWTSNIHVSTGECGINQINQFNFQEFSIAKGYVIIVSFGENQNKLNICVQLKVGISIK